MSTKKKVGILISVVILCVTLVVGYLTIGYTYQEYRLKEEINKLSVLDISKDKFNTKYVTLGDYRIVEKSIKEYLKNNFFSNFYLQSTRNCKKIQINVSLI